MTDLAKMKCEACRPDAPVVTEEEKQDFLPRIPDWKIQTEDGIPQLVRTYRFSNFAEALGFTNRVGELAETENHHPAILTEWGRVTVRWWTHKIHNLHRNDFIMASKTDLLAQA